jgi:large repetitive protein
VSKSFNTARLPFTIAAVIGSLLTLSLFLAVWLLLIGDGPDTLSGADGNDIISGDNGNDNIFGNMGDDILYGGEGNDTISGNMGNDIIFGGNGDDIISGNLADDTLSGDAGKDTLTGGQGADTLTGGPDADVFVLTTLSDSLVTASDTITDFASGLDHIKIGHPTAPGFLNAGNPAPFSIAGTDDLATDLATLLGPTNLLANGAAQVTITTGADAGKYVVINDPIPGYDPGSDAVVRLLGNPVLLNTDFIT